MKKVLLLGAALALSCGIAFAETPTAPGGDTPPAAAPDATPDTGAGPDGGGQGWGDGAQRWWHHHHHWQADGGRDGQDRMGPGGMRGEMMGPGGPGGPDMRGFGFNGPPSKGARFIFAGPNGAHIAIKCADDDSTKQCADAVKGLLDSILPALHHAGPPADATTPGPDAPAPTPPPAQ